MPRTTRKRVYEDIPQEGTGAKAKPNAKHASLLENKLATVVCAGCWVVCSASEYDMGDEVVKYLHQHKHAFLCKSCERCGLRVKTIYEMNGEQMMHKPKATDEHNQSQISAGLKAQKTILNDNTMPQLLRCIMSHLAGTDVGRLSSVCKTWQAEAGKDQLWKVICEREPVDLHQLTQHHQLCHKSMYKEYAVTLKKWTTGQGVTTFSKTLQSANGDDYIGDCLLVSDQYIFARGHEADHTITVFTASTGQYLHQLVGLPARPTYSLLLCMSENGINVAASEYHGPVVCVWNVQSGECLHTLQHYAAISSMKVQHGVLAVLLCASPSVYLWSVESGQLLHQLQRINGNAYVMTMNAQHIAVHANRSGVIELWDVNTGRHMFTWTDTDNLGDEMLLDAGTNSLVGIGGEAPTTTKTVTVWDTNTGTRRVTIHPTPRKYILDQLIHEGKLVIAYYNDKTGMRSIEVS